MHDVDVQLAGHPDTARVHLERVRAQRHRPVQPVHGHAARVEHGTGERAALDVAALVRYGNFPHAGFVRLENGTVSFLDLQC